MGVVFFLFLWPIVFAFGIFVIILPFLPYIILAHGILWLIIGLLARYLFNKHQLFEKGSSHKKTWVRIVTDVARWAIRLDILANIILIVGAVILAIIFAIKGLSPFIFW